MGKQYCVTAGTV